MAFGSGVAHQVSSILSLGDIVEPLFDRRHGRADHPETAKETGLGGGKTDSAHRALSARQYLYQLNLEARALTRAEALEAVVGVTGDEVRRVARVLARLRGRYLARVIDLGTAERKTLTEVEYTDLRRAREQYEELEHGFTQLKAAIEAGEIDLEGMRSD
ncbi:MAG: hypothetical protein IRY94_02470 [Rhodospirillaceae bacterium]|nr:hypothetical protein [Rhodospirillaceae bacterium]